jgi:ADP-ribose pyrophosphatase YjhB (NUDIX family)
MELGETIFDALKREVKEETGVDVASATLIAIYSGPTFAGTDAWGNDYQLIMFQFRVDRWSGSLVKETDETTDAGFFSQDELPEGYEQYREALEDLERFSGEVILK